MGTSNNKRKMAADEFLAGLLEIAAEAVDIRDDGTPVTNREKLQRALWAAAVGHDEVLRDDQGNQRTLHHRPASWAIQMLHDLILGKPTAMSDPMTAGGIKATEKVRELVKERVNALAAAAMRREADMEAGESDEAEAQPVEDENAGAPEGAPE